MYEREQSRFQGQQRTCDSHCERIEAPWQPCGVGRHCAIHTSGHREHAAPVVQVLAARPREVAAPAERTAVRWLPVATGTITLTRSAQSAAPSKAQGRLLNARTSRQEDITCGPRAREFPLATVNVTVCAEVGPLLSKQALFARSAQLPKHKTLQQHFQSSMRCPAPANGRSVGALRCPAAGAAGAASLASPARHLAAYRSQAEQAAPTNRVSNLIVFMQARTVALPRVHSPGNASRWAACFASTFLAHGSVHMIVHVARMLACARFS